ncbi:helix-turn-helix domain-containing protein [Fodinibius salicampi]|uniref:helix-turn-helix domain-containing protein n=1 Tax=Fodinibius salicampi TaxID=1920655 RepID=UPI00331436CE
MRLFISAYSKTPNQYLTERRIKYTYRLLTEDQLSVSEICFESIGSFSSLFKRELGLSRRGWVSGWRAGR